MRSEVLHDQTEPIASMCHMREREREHCLLQLDELDSNYDKNTQLYIIMYDKVNIKINIHIISH